MTALTTLCIFCLIINLDNENKLRLLSGFCESREALEAPDRDGNTPLLRLFTSKKHSQREDQLLGAMNVLLEKGLTQRLPTMRA